MIQETDSLLELPERRDGTSSTRAAVIGSGFGGLAAAIRLKQRAEEKGEDINFVIIEKG